MVWAVSVVVGIGLRSVRSTGAAQRVNHGLRPCLVYGAIAAALLRTRCLVAEPGGSSRATLCIASSDCMRAQSDNPCETYKPVLSAAYGGQRRNLPSLTA